MRAENGSRQNSFEGRADVLLENQETAAIKELSVKVQRWGYRSYQEEIGPAGAWFGLLGVLIKNHQRCLDRLFGYCRLLVSKEGERFPLPVAFYLRDQRVNLGVKDGLVGVEAVSLKDRDHKPSLTQEEAVGFLTSFADFLRPLVLEVILQQREPRKGWHNLPVTASLNSILEDQ